MPVALSAVIPSKKTQTSALTARRKLSDPKRPTSGLSTKPVYSVIY